jgi:hypothetical protein
VPGFRGCFPIQIEGLLAFPQGAQTSLPGLKGNKVLFPQWDEGILDYVTSLKKVYVPLYHEQIKDKEVSLHWKEEVEKGISIVVYDFDGLRLEDGSSTLNGFLSLASLS